MPQRRPATRLALLFLGLGPAGVSAQAPESLASADALARGRTSYIAACGRCHGVRGMGGEGPVLARPALPRAPDEDALVALIRTGIPGTAMPPAWWLSDGEARDVARFVRTLADGSEAPARGDPARGRAVFEESGCSRCHAVAGVGGTRGPDLTAVGARRGTAYLREAVLDPGAALPHGLTAVPDGFADFLPVRVVAADGSEVRGTRVNEDSYSIQVRDARGDVHSFYKPALRELEHRFGESTMRSWEGRLAPDRLDDLVAWLASLTGTRSRSIS